MLPGLSSPTSGAAVQRSDICKYIKTLEVPLAYNTRLMALFVQDLIDHTVGQSVELTPHVCICHLVELFG
jgi:hypothetical protein